MSFSESLLSLSTCVYVVCVCVYMHKGFNFSSVRRMLVWSTHEAWALSLAPKNKCFQKGKTVHACNPNTQQAEAGGLPCV